MALYPDQHKSGAHPVYVWLTISATFVATLMNCIIYLAEGISSYCSDLYAVQSGNQSKQSKDFNRHTYCMNTQTLCLGSVACEACWVCRGRQSLLWALSSSDVMQDRLGHTTRYLWLASWNWLIWIPFPRNGFCLEFNWLRVRLFWMNDCTSL